MPQTSPTPFIWRGHWRGHSDAKRFRAVMRGGTVEITLAEDGSVRLEGEVAVSFAGVPP